jgi:hypothetical protein
MLRNYVNKPRHLQGMHWRTPGMEYWVPPADFQYDPATLAYSSGNFVRGTAPSGETRSYETPTVAANMLGRGTAAEVRRLALSCRARPVCFPRQDHWFDWQLRGQFP